MSLDDFEIDIKSFDQDTQLGWRQFLPAPGHPSGPPTPSQFKQAGDAITQYFQNNINRGHYSSEEIEVWEFSLDFHAFQMYAQSNDNNKEEKMSFYLERAINRFNKIKDNAYLKDEYGPTVIPYLEATLIFLNKELSNEEKQRSLDKKLSEMLKVSISDHPEKNLAFFSGRVHDMAVNPTLPYAEIFTMPPKFPPLRGTSAWVQIRSIEEHRAYVQLEKKARSHVGNQDRNKTSPLIMQYQSYIEHSKIEQQRQEPLSHKAPKNQVSGPKLKK